MNIMITGSRGYIGRSMTTRLLEEGHTVVDYNRSLRTPYDNPQHIYAYGDLHDVPRLMDVMKENKVEAIVHCRPVQSMGLPLCPLPDDGYEPDGNDCSAGSSPADGSKKSRAL